MKDELGEQIMTEFAVLSHLIDEGDEINKGKGTKNVS